LCLTGIADCFAGEREGGVEQFVTFEVDPV
jgi:hypothetical protein